MNSIIQNRKVYTGRLRKMYGWSSHSGWLLWQECTAAQACVESSLPLTTACVQLPLHKYQMLPSHCDREILVWLNCPEQWLLWNVTQSSGSMGLNTPAGWGGAIISKSRTTLESQLKSKPVPSLTAGESVFFLQCLIILLLSIDGLTPFFWYILTKLQQTWAEHGYRDRK